MNEQKLMGTVLAISKNKVLVLVNGHDYYLIRNCVSGKVNEELTFNVKDSLPMPSYLFAIAALEDSNLDDTLNDIKTKWFGDWRN